MPPRPLSAIPGPKGLPFIGNLLDYSRFGRYSFNRMHIAKRENYERYGKIYKEELGLRVIVQMFDPTDIEKVCRADGKLPIRPAFPLPVAADKRNELPLSFGSMNGEPWWRIRKAVHPTMMPPGAAQAYLPIQNEVADDLIRLISHRLKETGSGKGRLDENLTNFLYKYAMEAFGAVCFNTRIGCLDPKVAMDSDASRVIASVNEFFEATDKSFYTLPFYNLYKTKLYKQFVKAKRTTLGVAQKYIASALKAEGGDDRKTSENRNKNFLSTLVEDHSERLTMNEMVQLSIELFEAGIDSTGNALSFCLYNLASNVDKQNRLIEEVDSVLGRLSPDDPIPPLTPETLNQMPYLKACVKESFRLNFPVQGGTVRILQKDLVLSDYLVPKGTMASMNCQTMCLLEEYFDKPNEYLPERWLKDGSSTFRPIPNFIMLPFGYGIRMCIGRRFAEQEIYLALVKILQKFQLRLETIPGQEPPRIGMINRAFNVPDAPIPLQFFPR